MAVPVALCTWEDKLAGRDVLVFMDNEPAKDTLIHGISGSAASSRMVKSTRSAVLWRPFIYGCPLTAVH